MKYNRLLMLAKQLRKRGKLSKGYNKPEWSRYKGKEIAKPITPPSELASEEDNDPKQDQRDKDMTPRYKNDNQSGQFRSQRTMNVVGARENVVGIPCFNCKEFGHFAKECRKPKWVKDSAYHKEKILLCKQAEKGVSL
nr:hypothetical protein [Tanacetum cinerariifolium]